MKRDTIFSIARGAARNVEDVIASVPPGSMRRVQLIEALAQWIEHAVVREVVNDRRRVRRKRA